MVLDVLCAVACCQLSIAKALLVPEHLWHGPETISVYAHCVYIYSKLSYTNEYIYIYILKKKVLFVDWFWHRYKYTYIVKHVNDLSCSVLVECGRLWGEQCLQHPGVMIGASLVVMTQKSARSVRKLGLTRGNINTRLVYAAVAVENSTNQQPAYWPSRTVSIIDHHYVSLHLIKHHQLTIVHNNLVVGSKHVLLSPKI